MSGHRCAEVEQERAGAAGVGVDRRCARVGFGARKGHGTAGVVDGDRPVGGGNVAADRRRAGAGEGKRRARCDRDGRCPQIERANVMDVAGGEECDAGRIIDVKFAARGGIEEIRCGAALAIVGRVEGEKLAPGDRDRGEVQVVQRADAQGPVIQQERTRVRVRGGGREGDVVCRSGFAVV